MFPRRLSWDGDLLIEGDITDIDILLGGHLFDDAREIACHLHLEGIGAHLHLVEPEVAEDIGGGGTGLTGAQVGQGDLSIFQALIGFGVVDGAGDEAFGVIEVVDAGLSAEFGVEHFCLGDQVFEVVFFAEEQGAGRADIDATGFLPAIIEQVSAAGALLSQGEVGVEVDGVVGAGVEAVFAAGALFRVDEHQAVVTAIDGAGLAGGDAGGVLAMHAGGGDVRHLDLGYAAAFALDEFHPEVSGVGLGFGIGRPVVADVLVLAGDLAVVTTVAFGYVNYEGFHGNHSPSTQASKRSPAAGS